MAGNRSARCSAGGFVIAGVIRDFLKRTVDPDRALQSVVSTLIDAAAVRYALDPEVHRFRTGEPLKLLLAGYAGSRNTGGDVRVEEMIRQFRTILGDDNLELSIFTIDPELTAGYFRAVRQVKLPKVFPRFLYEECRKHHGVVACEGSMFKSKFANALSTMMAGSLGMAATEGKLSVGYGAEAGHMDPSLYDFVRKHCRSSLMICRNEPSREIMEGMGIRTRSGTDTAWTFEPSPPERGRELLLEAGWDGEQSLLAICPINPFWWPTRPDLIKAAAHKLGGQFSEEHYDSIYFHEWSQESSDAYEDYLDGIAEALEAHRKEASVFPILVGSEQLDRRACDDLAARLSFAPPLFVSDDHDMYDLVSVLRQCDAMISSRYHAIVTSMPGGVCSIGLTMDERIHNLMHDRGHSELLFRVDQEALGEGLLQALRRVHEEPERYRREVQGYVPGQIKLMGQMGMDFVDEVSRVYPSMELPELPRSWEHYIPPLCSELQRLLEVES